MDKPLIKPETVGEEFYLNLNSGQATNGSLAREKYHTHVIREVAPDIYGLFQKEQGKETPIKVWRLNVNDEGHLRTNDEYHNWHDIEAVDKMYKPAPMFTDSLREIVRSWRPKPSLDRVKSR
ncbi:hypothetical protein ACFLZ7_02425 [Nanoarchaeota archaeon]